jgi:nucleotide-binding universal stress UspA family protein
VLVADERLAAAAYLARIAERFRRVGITAREEAYEESQADLVARRARSIPSDLVVLSSPEDRVLDRVVLASVARGVVRRASCPVLLVPPVRGARLGK